MPGSQRTFSDAVTPNASPPALPSLTPRTPTGPTPRTRQSQEFWTRCSLPPLVIVLSAALIRSNQFLMQEGHFPFPFILVLMHCLFSSVFALALRFFMPSLFPALTDPKWKIDINMGYYVRSILPIAWCFACSLVLSNIAYKYCSVAFLQMVKEGNIIVIYVLSVLFGIESFSRTQAAILALMVAATWGCVDGELNFNVLGFVVQLGSGFCEAVKTIFQSLVLAGTGHKLDPMSTVLVVMPMSGLLLLVVVVFNRLVFDLGLVREPSLEQVWQWRQVLIFNVLNSFVLNVAIAVFLRYMSPVSYTLTGNIKDICVVCMSAFLMHEMVSSTQIMGFSVQVLCIFAWTAYKQYQAADPPETKDVPGKLQ